MKEGWRYPTISEVGKLIRGGNFLKTDFVEDGFPCIHYGQIHTKFGTSTDNHITCIPERLVKKDRIANKGDLIIAITSEDVAGSCKCTAWLGNYDVAVGAHAAILKHNMNPKFVSYYFQSSEFYKQKEKYTHGFKVVEIKPSDISKISIPVPPLSEQQQIVDFLDAEFAKIDELKKQAEQSLQNAKDLFQAALKEMLTPKEVWMNLRLGEICKKITDGSHNPPSGIQSSDYLMLSSKNVRNDNFTFDNPRYLSKIDFDKENQRTDVEKDDVLLTIVGAGLGDCCTYPSNKKITFQRSVSVIKPLKDKTSGRFLMYLLQSMYDVLTKNSNGAAQKGIYLKQLQSLEVNIPNLEEQSLVVMRLDSLSEKVKLLQSNYTRTIQLCADLKQALLRQVFE